MPKYQAELMYPEDFDRVLVSEPVQIWFVDRHAEYVASLAHTAGRQMGTQLIEFQTASFDPEKAVIADEKGLIDTNAESPVYPWVCRYPGVWVLIHWGEFIQYDEFIFMTMVTVTMTDDDDIHPDPQLIKIPIPPKMDYTNIDLCMYAYWLGSGDGWELGWGYKTGDTHGDIEPLGEHPDFNGEYEDALIDWPFRKDDWVSGSDLRAFGFEIV